MATSNEAVQAQNASGHTMYVAVEVSRKSWTVALHARNTGRIGIHTLPAADTAALAGLVDRARDALEREHGARPRVLCGYEAGYEGFWLARRLAPLGIEPLVLDPASLPASRKARRAKTDRLDAAGMVRALTAFDRGEPSAMSPVRIPSVEEEDRRRLLRERRRLIKQRTMLANSVKGLLMLHGVFDLDPRKRDFARRLDAARTGYGTPLPPGLRGGPAHDHPSGSGRGPDRGGRGRTRPHRGAGRLRGGAGRGWREAGQVRGDAAPATDRAPPVPMDATMPIRPEGVVASARTVRQGRARNRGRGRSSRMVSSLPQQNGVPNGGRRGLPSARPGRRVAERKPG